MLGKHNIWGGALEIHAEDPEESDEEVQYRKRDFDTAAYHPPSDEVNRSWLLIPDKTSKKRNKSQYIKSVTVPSLVAVTIFVVLLVIIAKFLPRHRHHHRVSTSDNYTQALHKAILFFNAQRSGKLPKDNNVSWRGDSCLKDGHLVGGYFDAGDATKHNFPAAFAMTMLSWSVVEYTEKYQDAGLLDHVKDIIKWGTDYLLNTFNSSANSTDAIVSHVGVPEDDGPTPAEGTKHKCWMRPEEIDYKRPASQCSTCPALSAETAAALAAASIVFKENVDYSKKLIHGADILFKFATREQGDKYSGGADPSWPFYNSTGYWDEFLWVGTWMYFATGNSSYLDLITSPGLAEKVDSARQSLDYGVLSWDNKLPGALLLITRLRMLLNYGYPYEEVLKKFHHQIDDIMCSYLPDFKSFDRTKAGLILLNHGSSRPLQYAVNAAFLAKLYSDYMDSIYAHGMYCGDKFYNREVLHDFARTQMNYILGNNPRRMSYVVGFGDHYPQHVHHMGASIPSKKKLGCNGWKWRDSTEPNPNIIVGAMVAGPDKFDGFQDVRSNYNYTEPTLAGNSGLVAVLAALSETKKTGIDKNTMFYAVRPFSPLPPPPPSPWTP